MLGAKHSASFATPPRLRSSECRRTVNQCASAWAAVELFQRKVTGNRSRPRELPATFSHLAPETDQGHSQELYFFKLDLTLGIARAEAVSDIRKFSNKDGGDHFGLDEAFSKGDARVRWRLWCTTKLSTCIDIYRRTTCVMFSFRPRNLGRHDSCTVNSLSFSRHKIMNMSNHS